MDPATLVFIVYGLTTEPMRMTFQMPSVERCLEERVREIEARKNLPHNVRVDVLCMIDVARVARKPLK